MNFKRHKQKIRRIGGWAREGRILKAKSKEPVDRYKPLDKAIEEATEGLYGCTFRDQHGYICNASELDHDGAWEFGHHYRNGEETK